MGTSTGGAGGGGGGGTVGKAGAKDVLWVEFNIPPLWGTGTGRGGRVCLFIQSGKRILFQCSFQLFQKLILFQ